MREIILDTETTGLDPATGDRLVEIGCIELVNAMPTGKTYHVYLDPQRDMPDEAFRVHGLSQQFLAGKPLFSAIAPEFLAFVGNDRLVIHNAEFDLRFINAELKRIKLPPLGMDRVLDTLALARRKHPGASNGLDALCARYHINNSRRTRHGALLDCELLAEVYVELTGGHQTAMSLVPIQGKSLKGIKASGAGAVFAVRGQPLPQRISELEAKAHAVFVAEMGDKAVWQNYRQK